ncbi:MAG: prephenate dehydrogenase/arogenate dehydrogenase family protein [Fusobacteriota bacterium]
MIIGIMGVGLLGGSMGYKLRKTGWADKVIGIGRTESKLKKAIELETIDEYELKLNEKLAEVDILILAVPVNLIPKFAIKASQYMKKGSIITDVGSTKKKLTQEIENNLNKDINFIGGHPMAGSEKVGVEAFDPNLFENAIYVITETEKTDKKAYNTIKDMAKTLKAIPLKMDIDNHDFSVAAISHLPHLTASSLVNCIDKLDNENNHILALAAGGFKDSTRIASGSPVMWRDICLNNSDKIIEVIDKFKEELDAFRDTISNKNGEKMEQLFRNGKKVRDDLPNRRKGIISPMLDIRIFVPDEPGIIGKIANIFGNNDINIKDIEVLHIRENEGGQIRVGLEDKGNQDKITEILDANNYKYQILS